MVRKMNTKELQIKANEVRKGIVTGVHAAKAGHPGGSLSAADIFTYLYFEEMNIDPKDPKKADSVSCCLRDIQHRDFILHWHFGDISR